MAMRWMFVAVAAAALAGCSRKQPEGLPPAQEWGGEQARILPAPTNPHGGNPHGGDMTNPHGDLAEGDDPHGGVDMTGGDDPHNGADVHGGDMNNPHGADMSGLAPDPNRPLDPAHHVRGVIRVDGKAKASVKPGVTVFVAATRKGPDGQPFGPPLAADKLTWSGDELHFELSEANAMMKGTELTGEVVVTAHYTPGDPRDRKTGDVLGQAVVTIPADNVTVTLGNVIP